MTDEVESRLEAYAALVARWAPRLDLVSPHDLPRFRERHIEDCLRLVPLLDELEAGPAVDVGSGAGLPGLVVAIARPGRPWRLLEPRSKRAAFLEEAARELGLSNVQVLVLRAEQAARDPGLRRGHVLATARALAPVEASLEALRPLVIPGGAVAVFTGKTARAPRAAKEWAPGIMVEMMPLAGSAHGDV